MASEERGSVARCDYCGREFDVRRFQVRRVGSRGVYDSTVCAQADGELTLRQVFRIRGGGETRGPLK